MNGTLDDDLVALAAANAALAKRRAFRRAVARGDLGSPLTPCEHVEFPPELHECRGCDDPLYEEARSPVIGLCQPCFEESCTVPEQSKPIDPASFRILLAIGICTVGLGLFIVAWKAGLI